MVDGQQINLQLWDTAGQEDYKKMRPLSYPGTDIFVICFSLVGPTSLENVQSTWIPEIKEHCPDAPFILVGLKSDLRDSFAEHADDYRQKGWEAIERSKGEGMKKTIGAVTYIECSAKMQLNLKEVFDAACGVVLKPQAPGKSAGKAEKDGCCEVA